MKKNIPPEILEALYIVFSDITETMSKIEKEMVTNKEIFDAIGMNEQTYYLWVKKNPKLIQTIKDGYIMSKIKSSITQATFVVDSYDRSQKAETIIAEILNFRQ